MGYPTLSAPASTSPKRSTKPSPAAMKRRTPSDRHGPAISLFAPDSDGRRLRELGVAAVYTPKDFGLTEIMGGIVDQIRRTHGLD